MYRAPVRMKIDVACVETLSNWKQLRELSKNDVPKDSKVHGRDLNTKTPFLLNEIDSTIYFAKIPNKKVKATLSCEG